MPTPYRRLQLTLPPELDRVLEVLGRAVGKPQATVVRELLMDALPGLQGMADALVLAKEGKPQEAAQQIVDAANDASRTARQMGLDLRRRARSKRVP